MKLGIGIDTGGTYTDAVVYDFELKSIVCSSKALTTKDDLSIGILNALDALDVKYHAMAEVVSLSTTLATNACVENKGGRAKVVFIGLEENTLKRVGPSYGINDSYLCLESHSSFDGSSLPNPDWDAFSEKCEIWLRDADGLGVVEIYAMKNGAAGEKKAKELVREHSDIPVICASELFSGLNSIQRGAGTLLNAKLVPVVQEFLRAIGTALKKRGISAPVVIVRSDGSLMSEEFSNLRPVETILCGPASSVLGGLRLSGCDNAIIVDMGGTTTDISLVKNGIPVKAHEGIRIGAWRTFVRGVYIDTFALGGDSAVRVENEQLTINARRVIPLSRLVMKYPAALKELEELLSKRGTHTRPIHEFYCLVKDISASTNYSDNEKAFCAALSHGPLILRKAAEAANTDIYKLDVSRLESEGVVIRAGLTPTDIMHLTGDFSAYDKRGAELGAKFLMRCLGMDESEKALNSFCSLVYEKVKKTLFCGIIRILLEDKYPLMFKKGMDAQLQELISQSWEDAKNGTESYFSALFKTTASIVGIGAPTYIFLPDVARALGTDCVIPENAGVANAAGAVVSNISATAEVEVSPNHTPGGITGYTVHAADSVTVTKSRAEAVVIAVNAAEKQAEDEARRRGVTGEIKLETEVLSSKGTAAHDAKIDLGSIVISTAIGGVIL